MIELSRSAFGPACSQTVGRPATGRLPLETPVRDAAGLLGLTTRPRGGTPLAMPGAGPGDDGRVPALGSQSPLPARPREDGLGFPRLSLMATRPSGSRSPFTKKPIPRPQRATRAPNPDERPLLATAPASGLVCRRPVSGQGRRAPALQHPDLRRLQPGDRRGRAVSTGNISPGSCQVFRQAIARWGAPEAIVSAHGGRVCGLAAFPRSALPSSGPRAGPWQNLAESGFPVQRRMLDAYVLGCTERDDGVSAARASSCRPINSGGIGPIRAPRCAGPHLLSHRPRSSLGMPKDVRFIPAASGASSDSGN